MSSKAVVTVDYTRRLNVDYQRVCAAVYARSTGNGTAAVWFGYRPAILVAGDGTAEMVLGYGPNNPPASPQTDQLELQVYNCSPNRPTGENDALFTQSFPVQHSWARGG
jgi:hypothetical protein